MKKTALFSLLPTIINIRNRDWPKVFLRRTCMFRRIYLYWRSYDSIAGDLKYSIEIGLKLVKSQFSRDNQRFNSYYQWCAIKADFFQMMWSLNWTFQLFSYWIFETMTAVQYGTFQPLWSHFKQKKMIFFWHQNYWLDSLSTQTST